MPSNRNKPVKRPCIFIFGLKILKKNPVITLESREALESREVRVLGVLGMWIHWYI